MSKIKVVDDFLSPFEFEPIRNKIESKDFPWYWQEHSHGNMIDGKFIGDNVPQLIHGFVEDGYTNSEFYFLLKCSSCLSHLGTKSFDKVKANCNFKTLESNIGWFHTDYEDKRKDESTTAILYMNTNNGGTKFEDGTFVNSVANRMVIFDASLKHAPVSCTDKDRRIVLNLNYIKEKNE